MALSVKTSLTSAFPGMRTSFNKNNVEPVVSEEASAEIRFGIAVKQGTADYGVLLANATTNKLKGIVQQSHALQKDNEVGDTGLKPKTVFDLAVEGELYVLIEESVSPTSSVRVRCVAGGGEVAGAFRATADSTDCIDISKYAQWKETVTFATLGVSCALLKFDFTDRANGVAD